MVKLHIFLVHELVECKCVDKTTIKINLIQIIIIINMEIMQILAPSLVIIIKI